MPQQHQLAPKLDDYVEVPQQMPQTGLNLDHPQFEPVGIDPIQFDYSQQLMPPSMESPNFNMDYNQQLNPDYQAQVGWCKGLVTNYGEGGLQNGRGGTWSFTPTKRGGR